MQNFPIFLRGQKNGERDFAIIISYIAQEGIESVRKSCAEAIRTKTINKEVILNILLRQKDEADQENEKNNEAILYISLEHEVTSDCSRYDKLLKAGVIR